MQPSLQNTPIPSRSERQRSLRLLRSPGLFWLLSLWLLSASPGHADTPLVESFPYPTGSLLDGQNSGAGFASAWTLPASPLLSATGLTYGGLPTQGRAVTLTGGNAGTYRLLPARQGTLNGTNTLYLSFLARLNPNNTTSLPQEGAYGGLSLCDLSGAGVTERFFLGMPLHQSSSAKWGGDTRDPNKGRFLSQVSVTSATHLLVYRFDFTKITENGVPKEVVIMRMYVDPLPGNDEPATPDARVDNIAPFSFQQIRLQSGIAADGPWIDLDEIRLGNTFAAVTGNGDPLLAYEGFDYALGRLAGQQGGTGWDTNPLAGSWSGANRITAGLDYPGLQAKGGALTLTGENSTTERLLNSMEGATLGENTRYLRLLVRMNPHNLLPPGSLAGTYGGLFLYDGDTEVFSLGLPYNETAWGFEVAQDGSYASTVLADTTTRLLLCRFDFHVGEFPEGTIDVRLYVDPPLNGPEPATPDAIATDLTGFNFDRFVVRSGLWNVGAALDIDEIAYGTDYASAMGDTTVTVSGTVTLLYSQDNTLSPITFAFRDANDTLLFTCTTNLEADGTYTLPHIPRGTYRVAIKGTKWLQKVIEVDVTEGAVSGADAELIPGDANNDNGVNIFDLGTLAEAFNSSPGDFNWNPNSDFDNTQSVDIFDLGILAAYFNTEGDP